MADPADRSSLTEATLGAYSAEGRGLLVPLLMYKSVFLGEWFEALVRHEVDEEVQRALLHLSRDTLRETIETLATVRAWEAAFADTAAQDELAHHVHRRLLRDLLAIKRGNNEVLVLAAMRAPTNALRERLLDLADQDRQHADELRRLLDVERPADAPMGDDAVGAHGGRGRHASTLRGAIAAVVEELRAGAERPSQIVVSALALRHLRDERAVAEDGTVESLPVAVDFAWRGEAFAVLSDSRVNLSEMISRARDGGAGSERLAESP